MKMSLPELDENKVYSHDDIKQYIITYLNGQPNLIEFCKKHNLTYSYIINFRNNKIAKQNTKIIEKLCEIMGYSLEKTLCFTCKKLK